MNKETFEAARIRRDAAWARARGTVSALLTGLEERPVPLRLRDAARDRALGALREAKDIALGNIPVLIGTLALLAAWFFRQPLTAWVQHHFADDPDAGENPHGDET